MKHIINFIKYIIDDFKYLFTAEVSEEKKEQFWKDYETYYIMDLFFGK